MSEEVAEFVIYIINEVANKTGKSTSFVYQILDKSGCIENYLVSFYDILHTMSSQAVVEDVLTFVGQEAWR